MIDSNSTGFPTVSALSAGRSISHPISPLFYGPVAREQNPNQSRGSPLRHGRRLTGLIMMMMLVTQDNSSREREGMVHLFMELLKSHGFFSQHKTTITINPQLGPSRVLAATIVDPKWGLGARLTPASFKWQHQFIVPPLLTCEHAVFFIGHNSRPSPPRQRSSDQQKRPWKRSQVLPSGTWWTVTKLRPTRVSQRTGPET